jgi:oligopeptide/dipeptide ABC transporter ATP-binding protein
MTSPAQPGPLLVADRVSCGFGGADDVVHDVSLEVRPGEILGIVGESGSGKTTLLMSMLRLLPANARVRGSVTFGGADLITMPEGEFRDLRRRSMAYIPQRPMTSLSPVTRINAQLGRYLKESGPPRDDRANTIRRLLTRVGLDSIVARGDPYPFQLSGGQLQRILIAIATMSVPASMLLADEPTTTLDPTIGAQILDLLRELRDELGVAIIIVSHDLNVIMRLCDRVAVMYRGDLLEIADAEAFFAGPAHPYSRLLMDSMPARHPRGVMIRLDERSTSAPHGAETTGCRFEPRCTRAIAQCADARPPLLRVGRTDVRCLLPVSPAEARHD